MPYAGKEKKVPLGARTHNSAELLAERMRELALEAGFTEAGVAALPHADEERNARRFREWVAKGRAGSMRYLERTAEDGSLLRENARIPFPWARSVLVCFASYLYPDAPLSSKTQDPRSGWISRYAWSSRVLPSRTDENGERRPSDYHKVLLKRLQQVDARLHEEFGHFESRAYVDTGPIVERPLAVAAGLGWAGKNTCLIHPKLGSWGFLAVLLTSLDVSEPASQHLGQSETQQAGKSAKTGSATLPNEGRVLNGHDSSSHALKGHDFSRAEKAALNEGALAPAAMLPRNHFELPDHCGSCTRCIEACPTHALDTPYQMDATRCIAYLTIEHKGLIAEDLLPAIGRHVFGCDICQDVCPWNGKAQRDALQTGSVRIDPNLEPRPELIDPPLDWLASLDEQSFEQIFNGSPVRRAGFRGLQRNIAVAMGNSGLAQYASKLEEWAGATDEALRAAAQWALTRLREQTP